MMFKSDASVIRRSHSDLQQLRSPTSSSPATVQVPGTSQYFPATARHQSSKLLPIFTYMLGCLSIYFISGVCINHMLKNDTLGELSADITSWTSNMVTFPIMFIPGISCMALLYLLNKPINEDISDSPREMGCISHLIFSVHTAAALFLHVYDPPESLHYNELAWSSVTLSVLVTVLSLLTSIKASKEEVLQNRKRCLQMLCVNGILSVFINLAVTLGTTLIQIQSQLKKYNNNVTYDSEMHSNNQSIWLNSSYNDTYEIDFNNTNSNDDEVNTLRTCTAGTIAICAAVALLLLTEYAMSSRNMTKILKCAGYLFFVSIVLAQLYTVVFTNYYGTWAEYTMSTIAAIVWIKSVVFFLTNIFYSARYVTEKNKLEIPTKNPCTYLKIVGGQVSSGIIAFFVFFRLLGMNENLICNIFATIAVPVIVNCGVWVACIANAILCDSHQERDD